MKEFNVYGMSCAACSSRVERAVSSLAKVRSCSVNLLTATMSVEGDLDDEIIIEAVKKAGYSADVKNSKNTKNVNNSFQNTGKNAVALRFIVSAFLLIPLMYLSMGHVMLGAPLPAILSGKYLLIAFAEILLSLAVMLVNRRFFIGGFKALRALSPNMDTLVALGSGVSFLYSLFIVFSMLYMQSDAELTHALHSLYFESAAMIPTLITVGKMLEERAKGRTTDAIRALMDLTPKTARLLRDGQEILVDAAEVLVGDVFLLKPGDSVAVDGVVLEGESSIDESALTGESVPKDKYVGDRVLAATINTSGFLKCRATSVGEDTSIAGVIRMVERAAASKAPIAKIADRVSAFFVPIVMAIAIFTFALQWGISGDVSYAIGRGIAVLVISCPCALGLATPVAIMVGSGVGARLGILFKDAEALENLGKIKHVLFDKTGTLTEGTPQVADVIPFDEAYDGEMLDVALTIEEKSEHPLARAIVNYASERARRKSSVGFKALAGSGVCAVLDGKECYGGSLKFICDKIGITGAAKEECSRLSGEGKTPLLFTCDGRLLGVIATVDAPRDDAAAAVKSLHSMGISVTMLTGDNERTAKAVGELLGIDEVIAGVMPGDKARVVSEISSTGGTLMVGDGVNDAPALASATVGMAIGTGTDIAMNSAEVILANSALTDVVKAIRLSRGTLRNIRENLFWAFIYNSIGIPLAAGLFGLTLSPMFGAMAMSLSSFCVVMNALRLNSFYSKNATRVAKNTDSSKDNQVKKEKFIMEITLKIEGMMCPHCEGRVRDALAAVAGEENVYVSYKDGVARVKGEIGADLLKETVEAQGYKVLSVANTNLN